MSLAASLRNVLDVFLTALRLGLTSFGGPVAHLAYFERVYVQRKGWLSSSDYAALVVLCQALPGPASSQTGFLIGWQRAGAWGGLASWLGFTLPSAALMFTFALLTPSFDSQWTQAAVQGLKISAVPVVALAVWDMARKLCPTLRHGGVAAVAAAVSLVVSAGWVQPLVVAGGALAGWLLLKDEASHRIPVNGLVTSRDAWAAVLAAALLFALLLLAATTQGGFWALAEAHYRSALLVFGGGHVALPLLRDALVPQGFISDDSFLAGYGLAQALPGPLFAFSAYLGAAAAPAEQALAWSSGALLAFFAPSLLVALAGARFWRLLASRPNTGNALAGVNAAVVGILAAAFYNPVWSASVHSLWQVFVVGLGFALLKWGKWPPLAVVGLCVGAALLANAAT